MTTLETEQYNMMILGKPMEKLSHYKIQCKGLTYSPQGKKTDPPYRIEVYK